MNPEIEGLKANIAKLSKLYGALYARTLYQEAAIRADRNLIGYIGARLGVSKETLTEMGRERYAQEMDRIFLEEEDRNPALAAILDRRTSADVFYEPENPGPPQPPHK